MDGCTDGLEEAVSTEQVGLDRRICHWAKLVPPSFESLGEETTSICHLLFAKMILRF